MSSDPDGIEVVGCRVYSVVLLLVGLIIFAYGTPWLLSDGYPYGDDNSAHFAVSQHIASMIESGSTNFWWHASNLGLPLFAAYQLLPALSMGLIIAIFGAVIAPVILFKGSILLCWSLMPWAWARGARMLGVSRSAALILAVMTLGVHDPDSIGFGVRSSLFRGLYTQHFGLLILPLAVGSVWRHLQGEKQSALHPAVLFSALVMSHLWVGLYGVLCIIALMVVQPHLLIERFWKLVPVVLISGVIMAPWLVPVVATNEFAGGLPWRRQLHEGWPWLVSVSRIVGGEVFDTGRVAWLTPLVLCGTGVMLMHHRRLRVRQWMALTLMTGALFLGRTNWGPVYDWLPLHSQVNVMRYITGVHICGLLAVSAMGPALIELARRYWSDRAVGRLFVALLMVLFAAVMTGIKGTFKTFDADQSEFSELVEALRDGPDERFAVHADLGTGSHFHRDLLPELTGRGQLQSYAHGYHCTLSTYYAEYFDFSPAAAGLFGVGTVVAKRPLPDDFPTDVWAETWGNERYTVMRHASISRSGLMSVVRVQGGIKGPDYRALRPVVRSLTVPAYGRGVVPELIGSSGSGLLEIVDAEGSMHQWDSKRASDFLDLIAPQKGPTVGTVGSVTRQNAAYEAVVQVADVPDAHVLLKVNAFPWWHASVDGVTVPIRHVAPNFMAVAVSPGQHRIRWEFRNPRLQKAGAGVSIALVLFWSMMLVRRRLALEGSISAIRKRLGQH